MDGAHVAQLDEIGRRNGIVRLDSFRSVTRGTATDASGVDILHTLAPSVNLGWEIADLEDELRGLVGRRVDFVRASALHAQLRAHVLVEARPVYAAA